MSMSAYKPFKVQSVPVKERPKDVNEFILMLNLQTYEATPSSSGLFKTTYRSDFVKHPDPGDPRKFMIPKFTFI